MNQKEICPLCGQEYRVEPEPARIKCEKCKEEASFICDRRALCYEHMKEWRKAQWKKQ